MKIIITDSKGTQYNIESKRRINLKIYPDKNKKIFWLSTALSEVKKNNINWDIVEIKEVKQ